MSGPWEDYQTPPWEDFGGSIQNLNPTERKGALAQMPQFQPQSAQPFQALGQIGDAAQQQWNVAKQVLGLPMKWVGDVSENVIDTIAGKQLPPNVPLLHILPELDATPRVVPEHIEQEQTIGAISPFTPSFVGAYGGAKYVPEHTEELSALGGAWNALAQFVNQFTSPRGIGTIPGAMLPGVLPAMAAQQVVEAPERMQQNVQRVIDLSLSMGERGGAAMETAIDPMLAATLMRMQQAPQAKPTGALPSPREFPMRPIGEQAIQLPRLGEVNVEQPVIPVEGRPPREGQFPPPTPQPYPKTYSGVDPDLIKRLVPAIRVGERLILGRQGQTHDEVLRDHGVDPKEFGHFNPARGFVDESKPDEFLDRKTAEQQSGTKGTAQAGGLDSLDLPGAKRTEVIPSAEEKGKTQTEEGVLGKEREPSNEGEGSRLYSGLGDIKDVFTQTARLLLRNPERLRYAPSKTGEYDGGQLVNRLINTVPPAEKDVLVAAGIKDAFPSGKKVSAEEVDRWVEVNGPRVEVRKMGEGAIPDWQRRYNTLTHEVFDSKTQQGKYDLSAAVRGDITIDEILFKKWGLADVPENVSEIAKTREYVQLAQRALKEDIRGSQAHWSSISPKPESEMKGYVEGAVTIPSYNPVEDVASAERKAPILFPSTHSFPPNTLVFWRGYMDGDTFRVIEVQSDWGQQVRDVKASREEFEREVGIPPKFERPVGHPLLRDYNRLALKSIIEHAKKEGATKVSVQDAESAMMMEGHDRGGLQETATRERGTITQEKGMRLNYDTILPRTMEELTGSKGVKETWGEHKMAFERGVATSQPGTYEVYRNGALVSRFGDAETANTFAEKHGTDGANWEVKQPNAPRKDLIFRNPDGTPKTDVSGVTFDISKTGKPPYSMFGSKLYSGLPLFDPELWGQTKEQVEAMRKRLAAKLTSSGDREGARTVQEAASRQFVSKEERAKAILDNPSAKPLERTRELMAQPGEKLAAGAKVGNLKTRILEGAKRVDRVLNPWDVIYDWLDGGKAKYNGALMENIRKPLDSDFNDELNLRSQLLEPIVSAAKKMGKRESERIGVYLNTLQEGGRERMIKSGIDEKVISKIERSITPSEKKVALAIRQMYDQTGPLIQHVAKDVDGIDVKLVPNYFSWQREWRKYKPEADELATNPAIPKEGATVDDVLWPGLPQELGGRVIPGSVLGRKPRAKTPIRVDAFSIVDRYVRDAAHYIAMRKHLKEMSEIVRQDDFQKMYGEAGQDLVLEHLNTVARQGRYRRNAFLDGLRRLTSRGIIAFRIPSQVVHLANVPLAQQRTGVVWWHKGLDEALGEQGQAFLKRHFAETFERGGGEPALREIEEGTLGVPGAYKKVSTAGFWLQRRIDQLNAQATVLGVYMKRLKEQGKDPSSYAELPVDQRAIEEARVLARRAVASPIYKDVPPALARGGSLSRTFFQFQNTFLDQYSNIRYDLLQAGVPQAIAGNPKLAMQMTAAIGTMLLVETAIKYGYSQALTKATGGQPKEDETFNKKLWHEALRRVPGVGQMQAAIVYGETGVPSVDVALQPIREGRRFAMADEPGAKTIAATRAGAAGAEALGLPGTSQLLDVLTGLERSHFYKPHEERLKDETGKSVSSMSLDERVEAERQHKQKSPPLSPEAKARSAERNIQNITKRGVELTKQMSKADRQWIESRDLQLPGFDNKVRVEGQTVYLTKPETERLAQFVKEEDAKALVEVRRDWNSITDPDERTAYFHEAIKEGRAVARERLIEELNSESESNRKGKKRFSIFDTTK